MGNTQVKPKQNLVNVYLSDEQESQIKREALRMGLSVSSYLRSLALQNINSGGKA